MPAEYHISKLTPSAIVSTLEDSVNKAPRTGPIQGVNPNAKEIPKSVFFRQKLIISRDGCLNSYANKNCKLGKIKDTPKYIINKPANIL